MLESMLKNDLIVYLLLFLPAGYTLFSYWMSHKRNRRLYITGKIRQHEKYTDPDTGLTDYWAPPGYDCHRQFIVDEIRSRRKSTLRLLGWNLILVVGFVLFIQEWKNFVIISVAISLLSIIITIVPLFAGNRGAH